MLIHWFRTPIVQRPERDLFVWPNREKCLRHTKEKAVVPDGKNQKGIGNRIQQIWGLLRGYSVPLEACRLSRAARSKICREVDGAVLKRDIALPERVISMVTNFTRFALWPVCSKALTWVPHQFTTYITWKMSNLKLLTACYLEIEATCPLKYGWAFLKQWIYGCRLRWEPTKKTARGNLISLWNQGKEWKLCSRNLAISLWSGEIMPNFPGLQDKNIE